jgi:hypothetical protein
VTRSALPPAAVAVAAAFAVAAALAGLAGCSHPTPGAGSGSGSLGPAASVGVGAVPSGGTGADPSAEPSASSEPTGPGADPSVDSGDPSTSATTAASGPAGTEPTYDSTKAPRYPSPAGMQPPTATAASAVGCQPLPGGGWQATFTVTLTGGQQWAVLPERGPVSRSGDDLWTIVVQEGPGGPVSIPLTKVLVGGGSPFHSAYVPLGPGVATTAACPS